MSEEHNDKDDPLGSPEDLIPAEVPEGVDRRKFIFRSAVISAAAVLNGCSRTETERTAPPPAPATPGATGTGGTTGATATGPEADGTPGHVSLSPDLAVVKEQKGPVM